MPMDTARADARNAVKSLAFRAERDHPAAAACLLGSVVPRIEDGVLCVTLDRSQRFAYRILKPLERDLERYTDLTIRIELIG